MKVIRSRPKYRAIELYAKDTPFKPKVVPSKKLYSRKKFKLGKAVTE